MLNYGAVVQPSCRLHLSSRLNRHLQKCLVKYTVAMFFTGPVSNEIAFQPTISNHPGEYQAADGQSLLFVQPVQAISHVSCCLVCHSSRILVFHCILWDGCSGWGDIQGAVNMSSSDCGWLRGSFGWGSLLLRSAEQCPQNREHRESQVCCHILKHTPLYS